MAKNSRWVLTAPPTKRNALAAPEHILSVPAPALAPSRPKAEAPVLYLPEIIPQPNALSKDNREKSLKQEKFNYKPHDSEGREVIYISIENNRINLRWPVVCGWFNSLLGTEETSFGRLPPGRTQYLKDGSFKRTIPLNFEYVNHLFNLLDRMRNQTLAGQASYSIIQDPEILQFHEDGKNNAILCKDAIKLLDYDSSIQVKFPFLRKELYRWQSAGMRCLNAITATGKGALLCDEMGLGKTYTISAHLASQNLKAVVIAPAGICESWKRKIADISDLSCLVLDSEFPFFAQKYDIILVSYAMLKKYSKMPLNDIIEAQKRVLILDEGHFAKNYDSKRTARCIELASHARHTIVVTATPLKNRVHELHPLLRMTRRLWTSQSRDNFSAYYDTENGRAEIAEKLRDFMIRRMFKDVKPDFPKGEVGEAWLELSNRQDYDEAEADFIEWLRRQGANFDKLESAERGRALVKLNKLRELSAHGKVEQAIGLINDTLESGEQCIVFCGFNAPLVRIKAYFAEKEGINHKGQHWKGADIIVGSVLHKKRYEIIDQFMAGELGLLCIGTGAGGLGIDLPIARFAYFLDLPWTPADFEQGSGRILRLGQIRDCQFIKLLAEKTIDQRMETIMQHKAMIFQEAIGDEDAINRITAKDAHLMKASIVSMLIKSYIRDATAA